MYEKIERFYNSETKIWMMYQNEHLKFKGKMNALHTRHVNLKHTQKLNRPLLSCDEKCVRSNSSNPFTDILPLMNNNQNTKGFANIEFKMRLRNIKEIYGYSIFMTLVPPLLRQFTADFAHISSAFCSKRQYF